MAEAVCLVAGAGIGGGVMALPYLAAETGFGPAVFAMLAAYAVTVTLHIMVAELSIRTDYSSELLTIFTKHLFRGKKIPRSAFYVFMAVTLVCNLAAYITGAGDILADLLDIPVIAAEILFFVCAAAVVFLGLKHVAVHETATLAVMLAILGFLAVRALTLPALQPFAPARWAPAPLLAVYGMAMFSLSSLFAVPQAASGLRGEKRKLSLAVAIGLLINLAVMVIVTLAALLSSAPVTEVAIVGWAAALGGPARVFGSLFITLAMLGTFWSISLQLSDMTKKYFRAGRVPAWLAATAPSFLLALLPASGFLGLTRIAGGATAVIVACMAVPAYRNAIRGADWLLLGNCGKSPVLRGAVAVMYLLMAAGSLL
jgi:amino acid permease